jgi:serine/threonine protein kinase
MSVSYLPKASGTSQPGSGKYYIDCSKRVSKEAPTTELWLEVIEKLKPTNFQDNNRVLLGVLERRKQVVIKIGSNELILKEYKIGERLNGIPGFMKYICYFECDDDYKLHDGSNKNLCKGPGTTMKCLIMKYYSKGSIGSYKWNAENFAILKVLVCQCFMSMMVAFEQKGIIHNDTHSRNILMESTNKDTIKYEIAGKVYDVPTQGFRIVIMDFENAFISSDRNSGREFVYKDMGRLVSDLYYIANVRMSHELNQVINELTLSNPPFENAIISRLLVALSKSEWVEQNPHAIASLVYNPNAI